MFSLFKSNKNLPEVPEWASFFEPKEYDEFLRAVKHYFDGKNISFEIHDGILVSGAKELGFEKLGLVNVAQVCKQGKMGNYRALVSAHFESLLKARAFEAEFEKIVPDFEKVKQYIGVRLYPTDYPNHIGRELTIGKDFAKDLYAMLVFDLPESIINVQPQQAEKWNKTTEELFEFGLQNIKSNYPVEISRQKFDELELWMVNGNHFFAPTIVLDLENRKSLIGSKGALIGIPHRHTVIIYPIEDLKVVNAVNLLIPAVYGMHQEGPGSLSERLYWYNDGHLEDLPYKIEDKKLQFFPPQNFVELLNTLGK